MEDVISRRVEYNTFFCAHLVLPVLNCTISRIARECIKLNTYDQHIYWQFVVHSKKVLDFNVAI